MSRANSVLDWSRGAPLLPAEAHAVDLILQRAAKTPLAVAVRDAGSMLTYGELAERIHRVVAGLRKQGLRPRDRVCVALPRTPEAVAIILGVLAAGCTYVPLDLAWPLRRVLDVIEACEPSKVIAAGELGSPSVGVVQPEMLLSEEPAQHLQTALDMDSLAYVIFTSGSTGQPKGVQITHRNLANFLAAFNEWLSDEECASVLSTTSFAFDMTWMELLPTLTRGGQLVMIANVLALLEGPPPEDVVTILTGPSAVRELVRQGAVPHTVKTIMVAGEALDRDVVAAVAGLDDVRLLNVYGATETTVCSTVRDMSCDDAEDDPPSIGRAMAGCVVTVLDEQGNLAGAGERGEIVIGGHGVGPGYLNRADLTERAFVKCELPELGVSTLYRTGDWGSWTVDGELLCHDRMDRQIQIRGIRAELGDIEAALRSAEGVSDVCVVAMGNGAAQSVGAAIVGGTTQAAFAAARDRLPAAFVPNEIIVMGSLPLTTSAKVDRAAVLEALKSSRAVGPDANDELSDLQLSVLKVWRALLPGRVAIGLDDDFFGVGGHSLAAAAMVGDLELATGVRLTLAQLVGGRATIRLLAEEISAALETAHTSTAPLVVRLSGTHAEPNIFTLWPSPSQLFVCRALIPELEGWSVFGVGTGPGVADDPPFLDIPAAVTRIVQAIREVQPEGPYRLAGHSIGGLLAYEVAAALSRDGQEVRFVGLIDTHVGRVLLKPKLPERVRSALQNSRVKAVISRIVLGPGDDDALEADDFVDLSRAWELCARHRPTPFEGTVHLYRASEKRRLAQLFHLGWRRAPIGKLVVRAVPGRHMSVLTSPHIEVLAARLRADIT